ncbi:MAG: SCO family protein, partial [Ardenticatenales bacterium]
MSDPTSTTNPSPASPASPTPSPQPPPRPLPWLLPLAVVGLLIAAALVARPLLTPPSASVHKAGDDGGLHGFVLNPAAPAPDVAAMSDSGSSWRLAEQQGNVVALFFGYTHCPDVCPQTLALLTQAHANLGDAADRFKVAMVTVDPERDTADVMAKYMKTFDPSFTGLIAGDQLALIAAAYGTTYTQDLPPAESTRAAQIA